MLHQQDFAAIEQFQRLAPALSARWGPQRFAQIHEAVEELDFATALSLIEHATEAIATGQSAG